MGDTKSSLYQILEVPKTASTAEIKAAYRRLAKQYHPDRTSNDPVATKKFVAVNHAHNILKDEDKRKAYDRFGERGADLLDQPEVLPEFVVKLAALASPLLTVGFVTLLLFSIAVPLLVLLKADGILTASWGLVLIPVWVISSLVIAGILFTALCRSPVQLSDEEVGDDDVEAPIRHSPLDASSEDASAQRLKRGVFFDPVFACKTLLVIAFLILLACYGDGVLAVPYSPIYVSVPLYVLAGVSLVQRLLLLRSVNDREEREYYQSSRAFGGIAFEIVHQLFTWSLVVIQIILIGLRVSAVFIESYFVVFLPSIILGSLGAIFGCLNCCTAHSNETMSADEKLRARIGIAQASSFLTALLSIPWIVSVCLIAAKLNDPLAFSWAIVAIPGFVVLGFLLICVAGLLLVFNRFTETLSAGKPDDDETEGGYQTFSTPPPFNRSLED